MHDHHASNELSFDEIVQIIDILYEKEVLFITFTGGDIFTRKDFVDIYLYAKRKGFIVELYTNGALITDQVINVFSEYPPLLVDISLYGACEETYRKVTGVRGAFDKVIANIKKLISAGIRVSVKAPVLNLYYDELPRIKKELRRALTSHSEQVLRFSLQSTMTLAFRIMPFRSKIH